MSLACPEVGSFIGYKKVRISKDGYTSDDIEYGIAKLMITEDARRSSATSLKCRCNKVKVLEILDFKGNKLSINKGYSVYDYTFEYEGGNCERQEWWNCLDEEDKEEVMLIPNFDPEIFKEITGINTIFDFERRKRDVNK